MDERQETISSIVEFLPALRAFSRRFFPDKNDADDIVQETVCKALSHLDQFQAGTNIKSWLFTILRNTAMSRLKNRLREAPSPAACAADRPSVPATQEWAIRQRELQNAIGRLRPHQRAVLTAIGIEGMSYEDAAGRWKCKIGTIKSRLNRARAAVLADLGEHSPARAVERENSWVSAVFEADRRISAIAE